MRRAYMRSPCLKGGGTLRSARMRFRRVCALMKRYANKSGDSGVLAYEAGPGFIRIAFEDGRVYLYTDERPGGRCVAEMKGLAERGRGLCTYINRHVREAYAARER